MPSVGTASLDLVVDKNQVGRSISGAVDGQRNRMMSIGKMLGGALLGGFAVSKAFDFLGSAFGEAREAAKIGRLTEQVIKSTGKAAGVSSGQVGALAEQLSNVAGIDDEIIQGGANVLLTFTNIRNELGKGNNIFDQATTAALDMSVALGTDLQGSVIQIGKALNDPIKGVTALQRVGVSFTKEQKEQIKTLVETGRTMDAQKLILAELSKEFGGAAAAGADAGDKASVAWGNLKEQLGTALLPTLERVVTFLGATAVPAVGKFGSAIADGFSNPEKTINAKGWEGTVGRLGQSLRDLVEGAKRAVGDFVAGFKGEQGPDTPFADLGKAAADMARWVKDDLLPALQTVGTFLVEKVAPPLAKVAGWITKNLDAVVAAWATFKAISIGSAIVTAVAGAYGRLAFSLGATAVNGHAAAGGLGAANTAAAASPAMIGGATLGVWGLVGALGVGLGVVLHNLIEDKFPEFNQTLEDFGGWLYDKATSAVEKFKGVWESLTDREIELRVKGLDDVDRSLQGVRSILSNLTNPWTIPVNVRVSNAQALYPGGPTTIPKVKGTSGGLGGVLNPNARASGGPLAAGSLSWFGERGPELGFVSGGTRILSHSDSMRAIRAATSGVSAGAAMAGSLQPLVLQVVGPNGSIEEISTGLEARRRARS